MTNQVLDVCFTRRVSPNDLLKSSDAGGERGGEMRDKEKKVLSSDIQEIG